MSGPDLLTARSDVKLLAPAAERDIEPAASWMDGDYGREMRQMLSLDKIESRRLSIDEDANPIQSLIESEDVLVWMIEHNERVVGMIKVWLTDAGRLPYPSIHAMIGTPESRRQGVGAAALTAAVSWLQVEHGEDIIFSRYQINNPTLAHLLMKTGFEADGELYEDEDGLSWQDVVLRKLY